MGRRTSPIWTLPKDRFETVVKKSNSIAEIIRYFGFAQASSIYRMIKKRCEEDDIDYSHIPLGLGSNKGKKIIRKAFPLEEVMVENSTYNRGNLKKRLLKNGMLKNECAICGQEPIHNNKKLVMVLDHINGISDDHREENLRMLCPNCNSQEPTFAGRNRKIRKKKYFCKECGEEKALPKHCGRDMILRDGKLVCWMNLPKEEGGMGIECGEAPLPDHHGKPMKVA